VKFLQKIFSIINKAPTSLKKRLFWVFSFIIIFNLGIWLGTFFLWQKFPVLLGLVTLAYGLGLRHAVDADHIAAIDNTTRKFMSEGKKPVAIGLFFSLGHSTIVILLSFFLGLSTVYIKNNLPIFEKSGQFIGLSVSSLFLLVIGIVNLVTLVNIFKTWKKFISGKKYSNSKIHDHLQQFGILTKLLKPVLRVVTRSWHMYIVGLLFGLGFDTASEVGLLSISASSVAKIPLWEVMLLPMAFTAGMSLVDSLDGILMLGAYGWAYIKPIRKLYYNLNITFVSVIVALFIGIVEAIQVLSSIFKLNKGLFELINKINLGNLGYIIIAAFIFSWGLSALIYKNKKYDLL
jgi:high-affinity nickel-transport protein